MSKDKLEQAYRNAIRAECYDLAARLMEAIQRMK